jgi:hypothetical protein
VVAVQLNEQLINTRRALAHLVQAGDADDRVVVCVLAFD